MNTISEPDAGDETELPATPEGIYAAAELIRRLRGQGLSWRSVAEQSGYSRVQALRLEYNLFELIDAANASSAPREPSADRAELRSA